MNSALKCAFVFLLFVAAVTLTSAALDIKRCSTDANCPSTQCCLKAPPGGPQVIYSRRSIMPPTCQPYLKEGDDCLQSFGGNNCGCPPHLECLPAIGRKRMVAMTCGRPSNHPAPDIKRCSTNDDCSSTECCFKAPPGGPQVIYSRRSIMPPTCQPYVKEGDDCLQSFGGNNCGCPPHLECLPAIGRKRMVAMTCGRHSNQ